MFSKIYWRYIQFLFSSSRFSPLFCLYRWFKTQSKQSCGPIWGSPSQPVLLKPLSPEHSSLQLFPEGLGEFGVPHDGQRQPRNDHLSKAKLRALGRRCSGKGNQEKIICPVGVSTMAAWTVPGNCGYDRPAEAQSLHSFSKSQQKCPGKELHVKTGCPTLGQVAISCCLHKWWHDPGEGDKPGPGAGTQSSLSVWGG